mgnify:CR=1 FL=1
MQHELSRALSQHQSVKEFALEQARDSEEEIERLGALVDDLKRSNATLTRQLGDRAQLEVRRMTRVICMSVLLTRVNRSSTSSAKTR